jgi:hypothetical protein
MLENYWFTLAHERTFDDPRVSVICNRCRTEGLAGDDPFTLLRDLLNFEPVKRRAHVNGWTANTSASSLPPSRMTGSPRQAVRTLGRWANGAEQLRTGKGGAGFAEAWESALELYREREFFRIKDNLADLAEQQEQRDQGGLVDTHLRALPPPTSSPASAGEGDHASMVEGPSTTSQPKPPSTRTSPTPCSRSSSSS